MSNKCSLCPKKHGLKDCPRFLRLTSAERQQKVQRSQHCTNCLARPHSNRICDSRKSCAKCERKHYMLLHEPPASGRVKRTIGPQRNRHQRPSHPKQAGPDHQDSNLLGILSRKKMILERGGTIFGLANQTAVLFLRGGTRVTVNRCLFPVPFPCRPRGVDRTAGWKLFLD